jgi:hypothetical protein
VYSSSDTVERTVSSIESGADENLGLRITQVYRRESGERKRCTATPILGPAAARAPTAYGARCAITTAVSQDRPL